MKTKAQFLTKQLSVKRVASQAYLDECKSIIDLFRQYAAYAECPKDNFDPKVNNFSVQDKIAADQLLKNEKLKLNAQKLASSKHKEIWQFCGNMCTKGISDFDYKKHQKGTLIRVDVK